MSGDALRTAREALGLTVAELAAVLFVHPSSVHRWEAAAFGFAKIDGLGRYLLPELEQRIGGRPRGLREAEAAGDRIRGLLVSAGPLRALRELLAFAERHFT